jgi:hypothetical protein
LPLFLINVWILGYLFLYLLGSQLVIFAKGPCLNVVLRDAVFSKEVSCALYAPLREALVIFRGAAGVCMATQDQVGLRPERQVPLEVFCKHRQNLFLAANQAAAGLRRRWPCRLKVNTVKVKPLFQFHHFRRRRRFKRFYGYLAIRGSTAAIVHVAGHGIASRLETRGVELRAGLFTVTLRRCDVDFKGNGNFD